jgi:G3E family GTPase
VEVWLQVPLSAVVGTGFFSATDTCNALSPECIHRAKASSDKVEHCATSFVYRARVPFHPGRIHAFAQRYFLLQQQDWSAAIAAAAPGRAAARLRRSAHLAADAAAALCCSGSAPNAGAAAAPAAAQLAADAAAHAAALAAAAAHDAAADDATPAAEAEVDVAEAAAAGEARKAAFGTLVRSKGFVWLAGPGREGHCGEWSSAGNILRIGTGGPWFAELPLEAWPTLDPAKRAEILADFQAGCGDRCDHMVLWSAASLLSEEFHI